MQETMYGQADHTMPLKAVIEFAPAIEVEPTRPPRGEADPVMQALSGSLNEMIDRLATEAQRIR